jgi:hypothetical protein
LESGIALFPLISHLSVHVKQAGPPNAFGSSNQTNQCMRLIPLERGHGNALLHSLINYRRIDGKKTWLPAPPNLEGCLIGAYLNRSGSFNKPNKPEGVVNHP